MNETRFEYLLSRLLDEVLTADELSEFVQLVNDQPERRAELQSQLETAEMIAQAEDELRASPRFVAATLDRLGEDPFVMGVRSAITVAEGGQPGRPSRRNVRWSWAVAATVAFALFAGVYATRPRGEPKVARISGLGGSVLWTGNGGRVTGDVRVGDALTGGTIEGTSPDSWVELKFVDGSTVALSGNSMLTFSDHGRKELRLREGNVSGDVNRQEPDKPMLIHTRSALLEVLGTRFEVETGISSTTLNVLEGKVRVRRLTDGSTVDVQARHRVVTAPDRDMSPVREPDSVSRWKSQLRLGPEGTYGKWFPESATHAATLRAIPFVPQENRSVTLDLLGLRVNAADSSQVIVQPGSRFIVRGRLSSAAKIYFGIQMAHPGGKFAGKFLAEKPASDFRDRSDFEAVFQPREFDLDPCVRDQRDKLPDRPEGLAVTGVWSFTHPSGSTNLEITEVELLPPAEHAVK